MLEKFLKRFEVGRCVLTLGGFIKVQNDCGKIFEQSCGSRWVPWEHEGHVVEALNSVSIEGHPGPGVSIKIFESSLRERKVLKEIKPGFVNPDKKIWTWKYKTPVTVFINGEAKKESWTVSHWIMFSGQVVFDLAKNGIQCELEKPVDANANTSANKALEHKPASPFDALDEKTKQDVAGDQCDHGFEKNGGKHRQQH